MGKVKQNQDLCNLLQTTPSKNQSVREQNLLCTVSPKKYKQGSLPSQTDQMGNEDAVALSEEDEQLPVPALSLPAHRDRENAKLFVRSCEAANHRSFLTATQLTLTFIPIVKRGGKCKRRTDKKTKHKKMNQTKNLLPEKGGGIPNHLMSSV